MIHIRKSTKMPFLENRPKMPPLHGPITFSKMDVRGWYMPHFDRRDLLDSKKQVWGGFRNLPGLYGPICEFSRFFRKSGLPTVIYDFPKMLKKSTHKFQSVVKTLKTMFLTQNWKFPIARNIKTFPRKKCREK